MGPRAACCFIRPAVDSSPSAPWHCRAYAAAPRAIPANADGFVAVDPHGRVAGVEDVWAAGDGTSFPVKHGGLAAEQADAAAADIAVAADASSSGRRSGRSCALRS